MSVEYRLKIVTTCSINSNTDISISRIHFCTFKKYKKCNNHVNFGKDSSLLICRKRKLQGAKVSELCMRQTLNGFTLIIYCL